MSAEKQVGFLLKAIKACDRILGGLKKKEKKAREAWTKGYRKYNQANVDKDNLYTDLLRRAKEKIGVPKKLEERFERLRLTAINWLDTDNAELTRERDKQRAAIREKEEERSLLQGELNILITLIEAEQQQTDEIVEQVFSLNDAVVQALERRNDYLTGHVYKHLVDDDGNLRSQITITSSDGLKRVVAMVNTLTRIEPHLAAEAKALMDRFFNKFRQDVDMDKTTRALLDLTENIFVEKTQFRVGPALHLFLGTEIDKSVFPELYAAQMILRRSMKSEKTNSYVRLYERESVEAKWVAVKTI